MKYPSAIIMALLASPAVAEPMWEVSDQWTCNLTARAEMNLAREQADFLETGVSYKINFANNTRTSAYVSMTADITARRYHEGIYGNHNIITVEWDGEPYPGIVTESNGIWWTSTVSGENGRSDDLMFVYYVCTPDQTS